MIGLRCSITDINTNMSKIIFALCCSFVLLTSGCLLGDPSAARIVSLAPSAHEGKSKASLSINDLEVQEALKIIDSVLTTNGLTRQPSPPTPYSDGTIVRYQGSTTRGCGVVISDSKLEIVL